MGNRGQACNFGIYSSFSEKAGGGQFAGGRDGGGGGGGGYVPEMDPGVAPSAIALLTCGLLILATRHPQQA